jgi:hypothetical protein
LLDVEGIQQLLCVRAVPKTKRIVLACSVVYVNLGDVLVDREDVHDLGVLQIGRDVLYFIDTL